MPVRFYMSTVSQNSDLSNVMYNLRFFSWICPFKHVLHIFFNCIVFPRTHHLTTQHCSVFTKHLVHIPNCVDLFPFSLISRLSVSLVVLPIFQGVLFFKTGFMLDI